MVRVRRGEPSSATSTLTTQGSVKHGSTTAFLLGGHGAPVVETSAAIGRRWLRQKTLQLKVPVEPGVLLGTLIATRQTPTSACKTLFTALFVRLTPVSRPLEPRDEVGASSSCGPP